MSDATTRAEEIFLSARELSSPEEVAAYLDEACCDEPHVRGRVEQLLQADAEAGGFLGGNATDVGTAEMRPPTEQLDAFVGPYKLLQQIGEGGMGVVYMSEQTKPIERRVALKIIKPGMDTGQVIARFEAERQALAMMDHPNIARVLDAGTTATGRPFFVMELVKGVPITEYCDQHRLTPRERLELFLPVCQAVQHAHQKGIIHRDIKPSNVLVAHYDDHAVPKIIDFGVAKAIDHRLTEKTMFTEFGQVLGTLEYMSPEQARLNQWDVDTRSDIYSLGVLLYELLSGETPFDPTRLRSAGFEELLRIIREEEPPLPSLRLGSSDSLPSIATNRRTEPQKLGALVHGDLDWIVMKALEKDRNRRYESATGLRLDIQRYLQGDPVTAAPPSVTYRMAKFVKRHRAAVIVSALLAAALMLAAVGTSIGMARADVERRRANEQARVAEAERQNAETERQNAVTAREEATYWQYASSIPAADAFLRESATGTARSLLRKTPVHQRDYEWGLLANRAWPPFDAKVAVERGRFPDDAPTSEFWKTGTVKLVQELYPAENKGGLGNGYFAPDGRSVFFSLANGLVKEVSIANQKTIGSYSSEAGSVVDVGLSPTGTKLAAFTFSNRGTVWTVGREGQTFANQPSLRGPPWVCRWSPDEKYVITGHMNGTLRVWDAISLTLEAEWPGHDSEVTDIYMPKSGDFVYSASTDGTIIKRSFPTGENEVTFRVPVEGDLEYQGFSPKTGSLACAVYRDGSHLIWNIENEALTFELAGPTNNPNQDEPRFAGSFSRDETIVAVMTSSQSAAVYEVATGKLLNEISGDGLPMRVIRVAPGGKLILTLSYGGRAQVWTASDDRAPRLATAHEDVVYQLDFDKKQGFLLLGSFDSTASVWNLRTNSRVSVYTGHNAPIMAVDLHPEEPLAATLDATGRMHVWNINTATPEYEIDPESDEFANHLSRAGKVIQANFLNFPATMTTGIFTPDGNHIVAHHQGRMKVFDARTGQLSGELENSTFAGWPVYSHDSSLVVILEMYGKSLGVWNIESGEQLHRTIEQREAMVMADFSPIDLRLVTGAMEAEARIWDAKTGELELSLESQSGNVVSCRFSRNGRYILAGYGDSTARVWDVTTGQLVTTLVGHDNRVRDVRFNPDHTRLLSWAIDDRAIIWDLTGPYANQLLVMTGESKLVQARWTDDGRDIITAWSDGHVEVWRGASRGDIARLTLGSNDFDDAFSDWQRDCTNCVKR